MKWWLLHTIVNVVAIMAVVVLALVFAALATGVVIGLLALVQTIIH